MQIQTLLQQIKAKPIEDLYIDNTIKKRVVITPDEHATLIKALEEKEVKDVSDEDDLQLCESCQNRFDIEVMKSDGDNWFCPTCWHELAPIMKAEYDELVARGEIEPEEEFKVVEFDHFKESEFKKWKDALNEARSMLNPVYFDEKHEGAIEQIFEAGCAQLRPIITALKSEKEKKDALLEDAHLLIERLQDYTRDLEGEKRWMDGTSDRNQSQYDQIKEAITAADDFQLKYNSLK